MPVVIANFMVVVAESVNGYTQERLLWAGGDLQKARGYAEYHTIETGDSTYVTTGNPDDVYLFKYLREDIPGEDVEYFGRARALHAIERKSRPHRLVRCSCVTGRGRIHAAGLQHITRIPS